MGTRGITEPPPVGGGPEMAEWPAPGVTMLGRIWKRATAKHAAAPPATGGSVVRTRHFELV